MPHTYIHLCLIERIEFAFFKLIITINMMIDNYTCGPVIAFVGHIFFKRKVYNLDTFIAKKLEQIHNIK